MNKKAIKDKVLILLREDEESRNNDKRLCQLFVWRFCKQQIRSMTDPETGEAVNCVPVKEFINLPNFASIIRCRTLMQSAGVYPPTRKEVAIGRGVNEEEWRLMCGTTK